MRRKHSTELLSREHYYNLRYLTLAVYISYIRECHIMCALQYTALLFITDHYFGHVIHDFAIHSLQERTIYHASGGFWVICMWFRVAF